MKKEAPPKSLFYTSKNNHSLKEKILFRIFGRILNWFFISFFLSYRVDYGELGESFKEMQQNREQVIFAFWHNNIFFMAGFLYRYYHRKYVKFCAMVSQSKDGEIIARALEIWGVRPIRGSSSRGGARALKEFRNLLKTAHLSVTITPDGPKGPPFKAQPGIVYLAKMTGLPIVPINMKPQNAIVFNSWDSFQVPKPFSKVTVNFGPKIFVKKDDEPEEIALVLEKELNRLRAL